MSARDRVNVIRIEEAVGPDWSPTWVLEAGLRVTRRMLAETSWWRRWKRRALLEHIAMLEDEIRAHYERADTAAIASTRAILEIEGS